MYLCIVVSFPQVFYPLMNFPARQTRNNILFNLMTLSVKMSQAKCGKIVGLSQQMVSKIATRYNISPNTPRLCKNVVSTYAPRGQTPELPLQDTKGYQYVCIASSINTKGDMFF